MQDTDPANPVSQAERLAAWVRLEQTPGVGPGTAQRLLSRFGTPQSIFSASHLSLRELVSDSVARALCAPMPDACAAYLDTVRDWLAQPGHHLLTPDDPAFPPLLRELAMPPLLLYAAGRVALLSAPAVAVVGSRNATGQGAANARAFASALSGAGLTIVSGLALGIDAAAHDGGLRGPGSTVAVTGTGADRIYPRRNEELARRIAEEGCIVSEYPLGTGPSPGNFPRRNRLISGMCCAVLVVEAAAGSGSLITARLAAEQGRDVFAIPGSIHSPLSKGCHSLIRDGATLVDCVDDILIPLQVAPLATLEVAAPETAIRDAGQLALLDALAYEPSGADALAALTGSDPGTLAGQLLALELAGHLERLPGGLFQRVKR
ncbi:DNA-processing protein DprA [Massilia pseudoviolaceinigra]|uniref:DNA-processing protein DprA n=1 Tax=Massilia pseudoviolaceinigra TaxID=3057165 RepID=UPI0027964902|nr:DNA-processing protein DprA [Massilia sp. CCM 9206]MDQ1922137.1 DNA-processing protein DprA [Massilia sp. CCM 9206]